MEYTAVIDRFEGDLAVLLLEDDGATVDDIAVDRSALPDDARHVDAVLSVVVEDEELLDASYRPDETEQRTESAQSRFDRLSQRPPSEEPANHDRSDRE